MKDEISIWENGTKNVRKSTTPPCFTMSYQYLTKCNFPNFVTFCPENLLLLKYSPVDQCKCITHENFINNLKALSVLYDSSSFWDTVLCNNTTNSQCWQGNCEDGQMVKM